MKLNPLIFFVVFLGSAKAQNYFPLEPGNSWHYMVVQYLSGTPSDTAYSSFSVVTDTVAPNGKTYFQLSSSFFGGIVRVDSSGLYVFCDEDSSEVLLCDFSVPAVTYDSAYCLSSCPWLYRIGFHGVSVDSVFGFEDSVRFHGFDCISDQQSFTVRLGKRFGPLMLASSIEFTSQVSFLRGCVLSDSVFGVVTSLQGKIDPVDRFILHQNFPNPFNPSTKIAFELAQAGEVRLSVFNINGQRIRDLALGYLFPGRHETVFNAHGLASGVYFYRLTVAEQSVVGKMMMLR